MPTDHRERLARIRRFDQLVAYLRDELGWPIDSGDFEELTFDYKPDELGIDTKNSAKIQEIKRLRPLVTGQPWGIFFIKFEPKRLPVVALRRILGQVALKKRPSANTSERRAWDTDDLLFVSNYGEDEERRIVFAHFSKAQDGHDLPTLKVLGWDNLDAPLHLDAVARELTDHLTWPDDENDPDVWRKRWRAAFFDKMMPEETDFTALREAAIPLPESGPDGYRRVLFLGTTGAGKTTLVRQLIGTDPLKERFPSTSTAKTTIHDTEIVLAEADWRAVVTFASSDEVREYLNECISAAVLAAAKRADDAEVLRRLLNHVNQRFRFNYVLGNGPAAAPLNSDFDDDEEESEGEVDLLSEEGHDAIDMASTVEMLARTVEELRELALRLGDKLRAEVDEHGDDDERVADEIFEEELDNLLRDDEGFHQVADAMMEEIEKRFDLLPPGEVQKTRQSWPLTWSGAWPFEKRAEFLRAVSRFSSNYAPLFGRLLTPLVNGVRVAGPFTPTWNGSEVPKLVLLDGEGLGHTPKSSSAVSTVVSRRIETADAVLLVDSATQPMQAAPLAAMREVVATGNARKLIIAFTHFDEVKGDNLPNASAKAHHVLASAENVLAAFGEELGPYAERALRQRLESARFFFADIHEPLSAATASGRRTMSQIPSSSMRSMP